MKVHIFSSFFILTGLILLVGLACGTTTATPTQQPIATPTLPPIQQPTQEPTAAPTLPPVQQPTQPLVVTATEAPTPPVYFTEEFNGKIPDWSYYVMRGDKKLMNLDINNGNLVFNLTGQYLYVYLTYNPWTYEDASIDVIADNRGMNDNNVSLICRYSKQEGWYEFNISNDGLWKVFVYDITTGGDYQMLNSGSSTAIHVGKAVNEYAAICQGTTLSLYINGVKTTSFEEHKYALRKGLVGIGVASYETLPVIVEFDKVAISKP